MDTPTQAHLRRLFEVAAAISMSVHSTTDAEEEFISFVKALEAAPNERLFVVLLFTDSFSEEFRFKWPPIQFLRYFSHYSKWPELKKFIVAAKEKDLNQRGAARSAVWDDLLEAFDDDWIGAQYFRSFGARV